MDRLELTEKFYKSLYFLPIFGIIPAILTLNNCEAGADSKRASRSAIILALAWAAVYFSCWQGSNLTEGITSIRLLYTDALMTTGYFGLCFWMALKIWR
jgi:hypothetical protein